MPSYDRLFYKLLPKNDLGIDTNQGGVMIPKSLLPFFPPLPPPTTGPTEEYFLTLDLFDGSTPIATVTSRWHYQTWHQTRAPEHRLTKNLEPALLARATVGDVLTFERQLGTIDRYRVTLVRQETSGHRQLLASNPGKRWGAASQRPEPLTGIDGETQSILSSAVGPFVLFGDRPFESPHVRLLRDAAFARLVKRAYGHVCAACGAGWLSPIGEPGLDPISEPEAAHIVPVSLNGTDDLRNGLCLCRGHHWAFDHRLLYVDDGMAWRVIPASQAEARNSLLNDIDGTPLVSPRPGFPAPALDALAWHRRQVLAA